jgi:signal transduction histidine kinase
MSPYAHDATLTLPTKLVSIAYPLMDVLVLGVLVRLTVASGRRATGLLLLLVGFGTLLATDSAYGWVLLHGTFKPGGVLDVGWAAFYALLGAAALHPSTRTVFNRDPQRQTRLTGRRIALLAAASLAAPTIMMTRTLPSSASLDIHILAAASVVMFALVLLRMTGLMRSSEGAVRREAERSAELAAAERSAAAKDAFVSQVSHELRTPLTSILGYLSLLQEGSADEPDAVERAGYLAVVERNADRLLRLVEDLLFVARIDDGEIALEESDFDLAELAAQSLESARPAAENRMIRLRFDAPAALQLRGDRSRLAQVIDNLLSNAIKFSSEDAEVTVDLARSNGTARLVVADTGIGMRPDEIGHLFERFYRTDGATSRAIQGTGLGLSIAKAIVEAHRGTITATSELGIGTSLTIALPVA